MTKRKLTKRLLEYLILQEMKNWDDLGTEAHNQALIRQLHDGLKEDEALRSHLRQQIQQTKDNSLLNALQRINSVIGEKEEMIEMLAMKTTPYVNESGGVKNTRKKNSK